MGKMRLVLLITVPLLLAASCGTARKVAEKETRQQDSIRVEVRRETVYVPDTVYVEIPAQAAERTTRDSTSRLENDYATSEARINADGTLYHDLKTKPQEMAAGILKPVERTDSTVYQSWDRTVVETVEVEVERELSWWQQFRLRYFYVLAAALVAALAWVFRSPLTSVAKWLIGKLAS